MYNLDYIKKVFKAHKPKHIEKYRRVSVLIAMIEIDGKINIIFQKRSKNVHQSGDISFIGGHIDKGETPIRAVVRETKEECNLKDENIIILGKNDYLINSYGLFVHPFVGYISNIEFKDIQPNNEVDHLIAIPLDEILSAKYSVYTSKIDVIRDENFPYDLIENAKNYHFYSGKETTYFYQFGDYTIWGLTAKILHSFIETLRLSEDKYNI